MGRRPVIGSRIEKAQKKEAEDRSGEDKVGKHPFDSCHQEAMVNIQFPQNEELVTNDSCGINVLPSAIWSNNFDVPQKVNKLKSIPSLGFPSPVSFFSLSSPCSFFHMP
jgi:hypothetical protein